MEAVLTNDGPSDNPPRLPGWRTVACVFPLYVASVLLATYPAVRHCRARLPVFNVFDALQHIWIFRWYRSCLLEGRSPLFCPDIQYPVGAPLGLFTPLQAQSLVYLGLSCITGNDILKYNVILFLEFLFTGMATFALAWYLTRHRWGSALAGLLAMLGTGMMLNAMGGGTELLALGGFPLFLIGWMRFVDRPSRARLAAAVGLYVLLAACAPYYGVIGIFPAVLYLGYQGSGGGLRGLIDWLRARAGWFAAFGLLAVLTVPLLFPAHIWAVVHGESLARPRAEFERYGTTIWNYLIPSAYHRLNMVLPPFWMTPGVVERAPTYLGTVTLALLGYGAIARVRFRHSRYLWMALALMVVLSLGAYATVGNFKVPLPSLWLWEYFPGFRVLRVPARFGYFGSVCAAVLAAGAVKHLFARIRRPRRRIAVGLALVGLSVVDLAVVPFPAHPVPPMPACYAFLRERQPDAILCEAHPATRPVDYQAILAYWQSIHGARTSAGYSGCDNRELRNLAISASPFDYSRMADPSYPSGSGDSTFDLVWHARFEDYAWLYLTAHDFDYLILHKWTWDGSPTPASLLSIRDRLAGAIVFEDEATAVIDRRLMAKPARPVLLCTDGWRERLDRRGRYSAVVAQDAQILAYNPTPDRPLRMAIEASSYLEPRAVTLSDGSDELARWNMTPTQVGLFVSPAFTLPEGLVKLTLHSDGAESPRQLRYAPVEGDATPFSLWVSAVAVASGGTIATSEQETGRRGQDAAVR